MIVTLKVTFLMMKLADCTIGGLSYMDMYNFQPHPHTSAENPCNPLFWYPRQIPDFCYDKNTLKPNTSKKPLPPPIPAPLPHPNPILIPNQPLPFGIPLAPTNPMIPVPGFYPPYPYHRQTGMVPGIPGIVSPDGGINILPFSDVYADVIERRKRKRLNKKLRRILDEYEGRRW